MRSSILPSRFLCFLQWKLTNCLFSLQCNIEDFIFLFKYCERKVKLNTSEKSFVFFVKYNIQNFEKFLPKIDIYGFVFYAFAERCCLVKFSFEGNSRKQISVKRKHAKTNEITKRWHFLFFSQIFVKRKLLFSCNERKIWLPCFLCNYILRLTNKLT